MPTILDDIDAALADRLRTERLERNWSMQELASRAGVSKAMIGRIEQGTVSPTANLLSKIADALGLTLSMLLARTEGDHGDQLARADQQVWIDPETHYVRRLVSPAGAKGAELTEVTLPANTDVVFDDQSHAISSQQLVMLEGQLSFVGQRKTFSLTPGDWFQVPNNGPRTFSNRRKRSCRYLLISQ